MNSILILNNSITEISKKKYDYLPIQSKMILKHVLLHWLNDLLQVVAGSNITKLIQFMDMALILEKEGTKRCALEGGQAEIFTQKKFIDLINEAHANSQDYYLARVRCLGVKNDKENISGIYFCYDAKQLCKYVFEMVIGPKGRKIQIKNFKDPIYKRTITELSFFKLSFDSETPLKAEYMGSYKDFLESNCFRTKIFNKEDPLDALSVCFKLGKKQKIRAIGKRKIFSFLFTLIFILITVSTLILIVEKGYFRFEKEVNIKKK